MEGDEDTPKGPAADKAAPAEKETESSGTETKDTSEESAETETEETADKADGEDEADDSADDDGTKKKRPSRSERYQRQIERLKAQNEELRSRPTAGSQSDEQVASAVERIIGKPPNADDYKGDYLAFERAQTAYELDKRQTTREVKRDAQRHETAKAESKREAADAHQERIEEFREITKDFDEVMKGAGNLKASPIVEDLVLESEKSAHLVYYLARNPKELDKLNGMSERAAARAIGQIEERLSLPAPRTQTQARKPVVPLKGGAAPSSPERDLEAYINKRYGKRKPLRA